MSSSITQYLQIQSFIDKEIELFTSTESYNMVITYNNILNENYDYKKKIKKIRTVLKSMDGRYNRNKKKILFLFICYIFSTPFGYSLIQDNERLRILILDRYREILQFYNDDIDFIEELRKINI
jgi:NurA-like 5'-3' nuclease